MKFVVALLIVSLVLGCVTSINKEYSVGVDGSASFNKTLGGPTNQADKAVATTLAKKAVPTTTLVKRATTTTVNAGINAKTTTTTKAEEISDAGIKLTFTPDKETIPQAEEFEEHLEFSNLDTTHNYTVVVLMYSPGGKGEGGQDIDMAASDPVAVEWGIETFSYGMPITPFKHDEGGFEALRGQFPKKGVYHYDISVLDCTLIQEATGEANCGRGEQISLFEWEKPDGWKGQRPVFHQDKVITVT